MLIITIVWSRIWVLVPCKPCNRSGPSSRSRKEPPSISLKGKDGLVIMQARSSRFAPKEIFEWLTSRIPKPPLYSPSWCPTYHYCVHLHLCTSCAAQAVCEYGGWGRIHDSKISWLYAIIAKSSRCALAVACRSCFSVISFLFGGSLTLVSFGNFLFFYLIF